VRCPIEKAKLKGFLSCEIIPRSHGPWQPMVLAMVVLVVNKGDGRVVQDMHVQRRRSSRPLTR
jgi:hypothetical protein